VVGEVDDGPHKGLIQWLFLKPQFRGRHLGLVGLLLSSLDLGSAPLAWKTSHSRKMRNPLRSRQARLRHSLSPSHA
jgi:hypothetical protein